MQNKQDPDRLLVGQVLGLGLGLDLSGQVLGIYLGLGLYH